jgi:hypothetical protein
MRIYSKAVYQMTDDPTVYIIDETQSEWCEYSGPIAELKPKASPQETSAYQISDQERAGRDAALSAGNEEMDQTLSNPLGTPYGKALMTTGTESTNRAYNNATSNMRARASASGFGYEQPVTQGAGDQIEGQRAGDLARLPGQVAQQAIQPGMQAAMSRIGEGQQYNPTSYFNAGTNLTRDRLNRPGPWGTLGGLALGGIQTGFKAAGTGGFAG